MDDYRNVCTSVFHGETFHTMCIAKITKEETASPNLISMSY